MASTYTSGLRIEKPGDSEQVGTWGTSVRNDLDLIDRALTGVYDITAADAATAITLTASVSPGPSDPAIYSTIRVINATKSVDYALTIPAQNKTYNVINLTPKIMTVTTGAGFTTTIAANTAVTCLSIASGAAAGVFSLAPAGATTFDASAVTSGTFALARIPTITLAKMDTIADGTILGNNTGGASIPVALTVTQIKTLLGITAIPANVHRTVAATRTSSTLVADSELSSVLAIEASSAYEFEAWLDFSWAAQAVVSTGARIQFALPASATMAYSTLSSIPQAYSPYSSAITYTSGTAAFDFNTSDGSVVLGVALLMKGSIISAGTAGTLAFSWAMSTAGAPNPLTLAAGSYLKLTKMS